MEKNEIQELIEVFKGYRDLISPIEQNLREFSNSFKGLEEDIKTLNNSVDGNVSNRLDKIYKDFSMQNEKSKNLALQIDKFSSTTSNYISSIGQLVLKLENMNKKIDSIDEIQKKADVQIEKLNSIIEEKKKSYDLKELQKNLDTYNISVEKVSQYINKDVIENLEKNNDKVSQIKNKTESIYENISQEKQSIEKLIESYNQSNMFLKKIIETNDVNQAYIYDLLDSWAIERNLKIKK